MSDLADDTRPFPIQAEMSHRNNEGIFIYPKKSSIPWWLAEEAYSFYSSKYGTGQSLERLAERGGFGRIELLMLIRKEAL